MSMPNHTSADPLAGAHLATRILREDLTALRSSWPWMLILGILLLLLGVGAITHANLATLATAEVFGFFLLAGGVFYLVGAFFTLSWGGFFLSLLAGILHLATGLIIVNHPGLTAVIYTLFMAIFFFVDGLFRILAALSGRFHHWGWMMLNGFITLILGVLIWRQWPWSGLYIVGLFIGINLVISGATYINLAFGLRRLPAA